MPKFTLSLPVQTIVDFGEPIQIAATLAIPDRLPDGPIDLLVCLHGGTYSRWYWDAQIDGRAEYSFVDHCLAQEEHELAIQAVAVPLRNMQGRTVAALNMVTSAKRMTPQVIRQEILPLLQEAARTLRPLV